MPAGRQSCDLLLLIAAMRSRACYVVIALLSVATCSALGSKNFFDVSDFDAVLLVFVQFSDVTSF